MLLNYSINNYLITNYNFNNADGSGFIDYYLEDVLFYHMEWDALGNGSWVYYLGDSELTGTWTAG